MIGKVSGRIDYKADDHVLIEAAGIGYAIHCAPSTLSALPGPGEAAALYTDLLVREDLMQLYGFRTLAEREWHRLLTSVQGVGARASLAILGNLGVSGLARALAAGDAAAVRTTSGVGPKLAGRIVSELQGKAPDMMMIGAWSQRAAMPPPGDDADGSAPTAAPQDPDPVPADDGAALSALVNLGYDRMEAAAAVAEAANAGAEGEAAIIRAALRALDRKV